MAAGALTAILEPTLVSQGCVCQLWEKSQYREFDHDPCISNSITNVQSFLDIKAMMGFKEGPNEQDFEIIAKKKKKKKPCKWKEMLIHNILSIFSI